VSSNAAQVLAAQQEAPHLAYFLPSQGQYGRPESNKSDGAPDLAAVRGWPPMQANIEDEDRLKR
jgi:hypothetical protein